MIIKDLIFHMIQEEQSFVDCNLNFIHKKLHINILYLIHQVNHYIHDFILLQETSYMKMKTKYYIMGSIKQDKQ